MNASSNRGIVAALIGAVISLFTIAFGMQVWMSRSQATQLESLSRVISQQNERIATLETKYDEILRRLDRIQTVTEQIADRTSVLEKR